MDKIILINKEKGYTSRDIVNIISKKFNTRKVGHFGTLDPMATGLLVIGIGSLTKLGNFNIFDNKTYKVEALVGTKTDTYDITGNILSKQDKLITKEDLEKQLKSFEKTYLQEVPIYSAVKVNGKKLYEYARNNIPVTLPKKEVTIYDINDINLYIKDKKQYFSFTCHVSKGTYIRSLINDLSKKLNTPLCMNSLERITQGPFNIKDSYSLYDIENDNYKLLSVKEVLNPKVMEPIKEYEKEIINGGIIPKISENYILFVKNNCELSLYGPYQDKMKPYIMFKRGDNT